MKRYYILLLSLLFSGAGFSQTVDDVLMLTQLNSSGTARSTAMGGAFGALGGDFSSLSNNPAGIAVYRSSKLTFTPMMEFHKAENNEFSEKKNKFMISNLGYIANFSQRLTPKKGWQSFSFGIGYNHLANFNRESFILNRASNSSRIDAWSDYADGNEVKNLYPFEEKLAYDTYLISHNDELNYSSVLDQNDVTDQERFMKEEGYMREYLVSFGANYSHKFYIGATIGFQDVYYKSTNTYSEFALQNNVSSLDDFTFEEIRKIDGHGVNFKIGAIYKPFQNLRLGVAFHTPTYYSLDYSMETYMESNFNPNIDAGFPDDGKKRHAHISEYIEYANADFQSPYRTILSGAFLFGKSAIISVDYEMLDYSDSEYDDGDVEWDDGQVVQRFRKDFKGINNEIGNVYQSSHNLRIGAEIRLSSEFSIRGGYASVGNPLKGNADAGYEVFSGGFGFRSKNFSVDASYQHKEYDEDFILYQGSNLVRLTNTNEQYKLTFGFKF